MGQAFDISKWADYPMGPTVREYLAITPESYQGEKAPKPSAERQQEYWRAMSAYILEHEPANQSEFETLLEELTAMGLPSLSLQLAETWRTFTVEESFPALLALGTASMLEGELDEAVNLLNGAQALRPEEFTPYRNLAELHYARHDDAAALESAKNALRLEANNERLWEIIGSVFLHADRASAGEKLRAVAMEHNSFYGLSLAAELLSPGDALLKAEYLNECYKQGERNATFLIEFTAALGVAGQFEKIPPIIWEAEKFAGVKMPWQLHAHLTQAYLALNQEDQANEVIQKLEKLSDFPAHILRDLKTVHEQVTTENQQFNQPH